MGFLNMVSIGLWSKIITTSLRLKLLPIKLLTYINYGQEFLFYLSPGLLSLGHRMGAISYFVSCRSCNKTPLRLF